MNDPTSKPLVVLPTYNEVDNLPKILSEILETDSRIEVLVVDDNSPDGTGKCADEQAARNPRVKVLHRARKVGLGMALLAGFRWALERDYTCIFEMDADFSHNPKDLIQLYEACENGGNDMAIGSRYVTGVNVVNWPMSRVLMSYFASYYVRLITRMPIADTTAGFKCYSRKVLETIDLDKVKFVGYAFQIEMKFTSWKYGFKIAEVPIIFTDRTKGTSKMSTGIFKEALLGVIQMRIASFFKTYHRE